MTHPLFYSPFLDAVSRHGYHVVGVHPLSHGRSPRIIHRFTLGYSRPIYEQLAASHERMIDDVLLRRGRTSPPNHCGRTSVVWRRTQSSSGMYVPEPHRPAPDNRPQTISPGRPAWPVNLRPW